jgi:hypothetical protein
VNLFDHPLSTPAWEHEHAAPVRIATRALWTSPDGHEADAPRRRLIHQRSVFVDHPARLDHLAVVDGSGYHKCASGQERDRPSDVVVYAATTDGWQVVGRTSGEPVDLRGVRTTAMLAQVRSCTTDRYWPGWNVTNTGLVLAGEADGPLRVLPATPPGPAPDVDVSGLHDGVEASHRGGEVRYRTPFLEVGFRLASAGLSFLSIDDDGTGRHPRSLLQLPRSMDIVRSGVYPSGVYPVLRDLNAAYLAQGVRLTGHDGVRSAGFLGNDHTLATVVRGATVRYDLELPAHASTYRLTFHVEPRRLTLEVERTSAAEVRAWESSAWHVALDNRVTPSHLLGRIIRQGEAGLVEAPALWHFPRHGCLRIEAQGDVLLRSDSVRPLDTNTFEIKLAEQPTELGDYRLAAGTHRGVVTLTAGAPQLATLRSDTPPMVRRMIERHTVTALSYRPDTATISNNGASMHCTTSLNDVSAIAEQLGVLPGAMHPMELVGDSLERWLHGAPSYGSGRTSHGPHLLEDEYVHLGADTLLALARYLRWSPDSAFFDANAAAIDGAIEQMLARDVDDDGLVESTIRLGNSGEHQWGTAWCDVLSFGWKDAWANAVLHEAWTVLIDVLPRVGREGLASEISARDRLLVAAYAPTFVDPACGRVAGWRSADGTRHDYVFPLVNGNAVTSGAIGGALARRAMESVWAELAAAGFTDWRLGVPFNVHRVPDDDVAAVVYGLPLGCYLQGAASHHRLRVFVEALDRVGMTAESAAVLDGLATTIADDSSFGGIGTGRDWRMWDGTPSGYEGQLVEGFSVLASGLRRYARPG